MKLLGVMLGTEDATKLADFYTKAFGKPGWEMDGWYGYMIGGGMVMIGNHSEVKGQSQNPQRIIISVESTDVARDFEKIKQAGAKVVAEPYHPDPKNETIWLATLADPDGNYLQLASPWES